MMKLSAPTTPIVASSVWVTLNFLTRTESTLASGHRCVSGRASFEVALGVPIRESLVKLAHFTTFTESAVQTCTGLPDGGVSAEGGTCPHAKHPLMTT